MLEVFHQEGELFIFVWVGGAEGSELSMDGVDGSIGDGSAVCDTGVTSGCLVVLIVKNFWVKNCLNVSPVPGVSGGKSVSQLSQALSM